MYVYVLYQWYNSGTHIGATILLTVVKVVSVSNVSYWKGEREKLRVRMSGVERERKKWNEREERTSREQGKKRTSNTEH